MTCGPGLVGALLVGVEVAKALGYALGKPVVGVNHLAGHLAAAAIEASEARARRRRRSRTWRCWCRAGTRCCCGGRARSRRALLGSTRDDAAGEAFDKVAKLLGLGYPGGVVIDKLAATGNPQRAQLSPAAARARRPRLLVLGAEDGAGHRSWATGRGPQGQALADVCASFQAAVVDVLVRKSRRALQLQGLRDLVVCGGVAANRGLRAALAQASAEDGFGLYIPSPRLCTDNAAMIAAAGTELLRAGAAGAAGPQRRSRAAARVRRRDAGAGCAGAAAEVGARAAGGARAAAEEVVGPELPGRSAGDRAHRRTRPRWRRRTRRWRSAPGWGR